MAKRKAGKGRSLTITGVKEIDQKLRKLSEKVERKVIRGAMRKGLKPVQAKAVQYAPYDPNHDGPYPHVRDAIKIRAGKRKKGRITIVVRVGEGDYKGRTFYAAFLEFGTKHMIARPFMGPAFDEKERSARTTTIDEILKGIEKEAGKK